MNDLSLTVVTLKFLHMFRTVYNLESLEAQLCEFRLVCMFD
jgi:hypothetical protein